MNPMIEEQLIYFYDSAIAYGVDNLAQFAEENASSGQITKENMNNLEQHRSSLCDDRRNRISGCSIRSTDGQHGK